MTIVETLASEAPVLIAIDDVQWLDPSSQAVVSFVARRLKGRACLIATERSEPGREGAVLAATRHAGWDRPNQGRPVEPRRRARSGGCATGAGVSATDDGAHRRCVGWQSVLRARNSARDRRSIDNGR